MSKELNKIINQLAAKTKYEKQRGRKYILKNKMNEAALCAGRVDAYNYCIIQLKNLNSEQSVQECDATDGE